MVGGESPDAARWRCGRRVWDLRRRALVMGVLNVTPDSFYDGGRFATFDAALRQVETMAAEGADLIDVGAESTRPGAEPVPVEEELRRLLPVLEALRARWDLPLSVDTTKAAVAREALARGVEVVNDISGLSFDPAMAETIAAAGAGCILMHIRGKPRDMQNDPRYEDLLGEIRQALAASLARARAAGIPEEAVAIDPGIGFGKTREHSLRIIRELEALAPLGRPICLGPSRKSFIARTLGVTPAETLEGTLAACVLGFAHGARVLRVHDVGPARRALRIAEAILAEEEEP